MLHELRHDPPGHVDGDGEADPLRRLDDRRVDADDPAPAVEQRPAAVARVERGVGLDDVVDEVAGDAPQGAAQGADDARRSPSSRSRTGCRWRPRAGRRAASAESPSVACGRPDASACTTATSVHGSAPTTRPATSRPSFSRTRKRLRAADDVMVGEQEAVGREQESGPRSAAADATLAGLGPQVDDRRAQRLGHGDDHPRVGIQGLAFFLLGGRSIGDRGGRLLIRVDQPRQIWAHASRPFLSRKGLCGRYCSPAASSRRCRIVRSHGRRSVREAR